MIKTLFAAIAAAIAAALLAGSLKLLAVEGGGSRHAELARPESDPVVESFERELHRQPVPASPATGEAIDEDLLYRIVNEAHWTPVSEDAPDPTER